MYAKLFCPALLAGIALCTSGCDRSAQSPASAAPDAAAAPSSVQQIMLASLTPQSSTLWELAGKLYDDAGNPSAAQLTDEEWKTLHDTASAMQAASAQLGNASQIKVAAAGAKIQSEGTPGALGAAEVQA